MTGQAGERVSHELRIRLGDPQMRRSRLSRWHTIVDPRKPGCGIVLERDGPGTDAKRDPVPGGADLHRFTGIEFFAAQHWPGRHEPIVGPGEVETGLDQHMVTVGCGQVATAAQLQAIQRVAGRFSIGSRHRVTQGRPQFGRVGSILGGQFGPLWWREPGIDRAFEPLWHATLREAE